MSAPAGRGRWTGAARDERDRAQALGPYAVTLDGSNRTRLWVHLENGGAQTVVLQAIGRGGVGSPAIDSIAKEFESARP